jgi:AraC-like DNA-binding protein|tara:strand:+ start:1474 stop:2520 length:1047 start_codon:yes stop_codon:yes gene_type:complete
MQKYYVDAAVHQSVWELAKTEKIEISRLLEGTGLDPQDMQCPRGVLTTVQHFRLLYNLIILSARPAIGLMVGGQARLESLGILGMAMLCAPSIRHALELGASFGPMYGSLGEFSLSTEKDALVVGLSLPAVNFPLKRYLTEDGFAATYSYIKVLSSFPSRQACSSPGEKVLAKKIRFSYPKPKYVNLYEDFFKCPLEFDAPESELHFDESVLARPAMLSNPLALKQCTELCQRLASEMAEEPPIIQKVKQHISEKLLAESRPENIADILGISQRTLQRLLGQAGTSFSQVRADVCQSEGERLLSNPSLTLEEIARLLGYSDSSNFRRAFKHWTGLSPSQFRVSLKTIS